MTVNDKVVSQSQKLVSKAVGVFTQAITEVEKANTILIKGIETDSMTILGITNQIKDLEAKMISHLEAKDAKGAEIKANNALIENLKQFI